METQDQNIYNPQFGVFKSYYVVWKLKYIYNNLTDKESLNRTMQYGNFFLHVALVLRWFV